MTMSEFLKEIKFLNDLPDQVIVIDKFKTINFANKSAKTRFDLILRVKIFQVLCVMLNCWIRSINHWKIKGI